MPASSPIRSCAAAALLLVVQVAMGNGPAKSPDPSAWNFVQLAGSTSLDVGRMPGALRATVNPEGFEVTRENKEAIARFRVLGSNRGAGPIRPWCPGPMALVGNEVYFPGERMAVHYMNGMEGLRQNFMVFDRPSGTGDLRITLAISTPLRPSLSDGGDLRFSDHKGDVLLSYRDLTCWDAMDRPLRAHFELSDGGRTFAIVVEDAEATYPVTIDPVSTTPNTLLLGTEPGAEFGFSVATAGDLNGDGRSDVAVGAWRQTVSGAPNAGAVSVYYGTNTGISTVPSIVLTNGQGGAQFGNAVNTAGDVNGDGYADLLVSARTWESNTTTDLSEGTVFVYYGSAAGISNVPSAQLQPDHADDNFGSNAACAGDLNNDGYSDVVVGAYLASYPGFNEGAVFVYMGSAAGLNTVPAHRLERNQSAAFFGRSVNCAGDVNGDGYSDLIVGATKFIYTTGASDQGAAFIYYGSAIGLGAGLNPAPSVTLTGTGVDISYYGWWVASAGDLNGDGYSDVTVGAYQEEQGAETDEGLVYVYHGSATGITNVPAIILQCNQAGAWLGRCVGTAGDVNGDGYSDLLVGVTRYANPDLQEGRIQVHLGSASGIVTAPSFTMELNNAGAQFGESCSTAGDVNGDGFSDIIAGARVYGTAGGAAIFHGGPYGTNTLPSSTWSGGAATAALGTSVANAGDVNGDGFADALFGAPDASNGQAGEGLVRVHYGSATGLPAAPSLVLEANVAGARFGASVASAGDVNGDGYADVVIGAPNNGSGTAYLHMGSPGGLNPAPALSLTMGALFGASVATAGDVDHDGYADVIIGSPGNGTAYLFQGSTAGLITTPDVVLTEMGGTGTYGCSVSTAGDVNGDGYSDVIVGARTMTNGQASEGVAYVYHGSVNGLVTPYARLIEVNQASANFGVSVAGAGDVNGDGFFDVVVGADLWESGQTDEGGAFIFHGSLAGVAAAPAITLQRNVVSGAFGASVAEAGDVNGDGYADVVIGAPLMETSAAGTNDEGFTFIYRGSPTGLAAANFDQLESNLAAYRLGACVSGGGDNDGDGYSDVYAGAPSANPAFAGEGAAYWFRGDQNRGRERLTRQYDADLVSPMSTNSSDFANVLFFGVGHKARSPIQRCRVRLRWEVVFEGQPFSNNPITNSVTQTAIASAWTTLPLNGVELKQLVPKVGGVLRHKWRLRIEYDLPKQFDGQRFSRWFYGFANGIGDIGVLPVELIDFSGRALEEANELTWTTATEHNSDHFVLLRSDDGAAFRTLTQVAAAGESQNPIPYRALDPSPNSGPTYYKLLMVDRDGSAETSPSVIVSRGAGELVLFPNPTDGLLYVALDARTNARSLMLVAVDGRCALTQPINDASRVEVNVRTLAPDLYQVHVLDAAGAVIASAPVIVQ